MTLKRDFQLLAQGSLSADELQQKRLQYNRNELLDVFDSLVPTKLLWKRVELASGVKVRLVDVLFNLVQPDLEGGVVLPVGYQQSMSIFTNAIVSSGLDAHSLRVVFVSLLDYIELYFGTRYTNAKKIKQYQKSKALVEGHEAVANLRIGEVVGYPQALPEIQVAHQEEIESEDR